MFTSKQRANLRSLASMLKPIGQVGKEGVTRDQATSEGKYNLQNNQRLHVYAPIKGDAGKPVYKEDGQFGAGYYVTVVCLRCNWCDGSGTVGTLEGWVSGSAQKSYVFVQNKAELEASDVTDKETLKAQFDEDGKAQELETTYTYVTEKNIDTFLRGESDSADKALEGIVQLSGDMEVKDGKYFDFVEGAEATLDLNGHTLTSTYQEGQVPSAGNLSIENTDKVTLKNGTYKVSATTKIQDAIAPGIIVWDGGELTMEDVTVISSSQGYAVQVIGTATLTRCTIVNVTNTDKGIGLVVGGTHNGWHDGNVTLNDCKIISTLSAEEEGNGGLALATSGGTINAKGTEFIGYSGALQFNTTGGAVNATFTDCKFTIGVYDVETGAVDTASELVKVDMGVIAMRAENAITLTLAGTVTYNIAETVKDPKIYALNTVDQNADNLAITVPAENAKDVTLDASSKTIKVNGTETSYVAP